MNNFFYSISVNDRFRFPVFGEGRKDSVVNNDSTEEDEVIEEEVSKEVQSLMEAEDSYFEVFKQTNCEKGLYCDEILHFLEGFFKRVRSGTRPWRSFQAFLDSFSTYIHNHSNEFRELLDTMNTKRLITPYLELDLPVNIIEEFNRLEEGDPRIHLYQLNPVWGPAIKEFGFFWERYESTKEVLCLFVWSTIDNTVVPLPAVGLNPYPLCWVCDKGFGTLACTRCQVAKYCSKECLQKDWIRHSGPVCDVMAASLRRVKQLSFKRPPSPRHASPPPAAVSLDPPLPSTPPSHPSSNSSASSSSSRSPASSRSPSPSPSPPSSPPSKFSFSYQDSDPPFSIMEEI